VIATNGLPARFRGRHVVVAGLTDWCSSPDASVIAVWARSERVCLHDG
jgi:hypothetical protein